MFGIKISVETSGSLLGLSLKLEYYCTWDGRDNYLCEALCPAS